MFTHHWYWVMDVSHDFKIHISAYGWITYGLGLSLYGVLSTQGKICTSKYFNIICKPINTIVMISVSWAVKIPQAGFKISSKLLLNESCSKKNWVLRIEKCQALEIWLITACENVLTQLTLHMIKWVSRTIAPANNHIPKN